MCVGSFCFFVVVKSIITISFSPSKFCLNIHPSWNQGFCIVSTPREDRLVRHLHRRSCLWHHWKPLQGAAGQDKMQRRDNKQLQLLEDDSIMKRQVLEISHSTVTDNGLRFISQGPKGEHRWFSAFWRNCFTTKMESLEEDTHRVESVWCNIVICLYLDRIRCPKLTTLGLQGARVSRYVIVITKCQSGYFDESLKVQNYEKNISLVYFDDQTRGCRPPALSPCVKRWEFIKD